MSALKRLFKLDSWWGSQTRGPDGDRSEPQHHLPKLAQSSVGQPGRIDDQQDPISVAIELHRQALLLRPRGHPDRPASLNDLAIALQDRFNSFRRMEDQDEAIALHRESLALRPLGHRDRPASLNHLANAVQNRFNSLGRMEDVEEAIALHREALTLRPHGHRDRPVSLDILALALQNRFKLLGRIEDQEEAIALHRGALALRPPGDRDRPASLNHVAIALQNRFNSLGKTEDQDEAIGLHRAALALRPLGHRDRPASLNHLAAALQNRFNSRGGTADLEEAIALHREALAVRPPGHRDRPASLDHLAIAIQSRFDSLGRIEDQEEAIALHREALALRPPGHPDRPVSLKYLATALRSQFDPLDRKEGRNQAVGQAPALQPPAGGERAALSNLALAPLDQFDSPGRTEDLEKAIALHREALALRPPGHSDRSASLSDLADIVQARFEQLGRIEDLEEVIRCHSQILKLHPPDDPEHSHALNKFHKALESMIWNTCHSNSLKKWLLAVRGDLLPKVLLIMQNILDDSYSYTEHVASIRHRSIRRLLIRVSKESGTLPKSLFLDGVDCADKEMLIGGGFADIFLASYSGRPVALKRLRVFRSTQDNTGDLGRRAICQEALVWRQLRHRHILPFLGVDCQTFGSHFCLVSPWMSHGNVNGCIQELNAKGKHIPVDNWILQIAEGLRYLHEERIVHGDLRAANVLIDEDLHVRLADFGLAFFAETSTTSLGTHASGACRWMSPEWLSDELSRPDYACDVYSFGCICIEIYTGNVPFSDLQTDFQVISQVVYRGARPARPDDKTGTSRAMSDQLWELVGSCWHRVSSERPSASRLVRCLEAMAADSEPLKMSAVQS